MAKKLLGLLAAGILGASLASASTVNAVCTGGVGGSSPNSGQVNSTTAGSTPSLSQTLSCTGFTVPPNYTLDQVDIFIQGGYNNGNKFATTGNTLNWVYTVSNVTPPLQGSSTEVVVGGNAPQTYTFNGCTNVVVIGNTEDCTTYFAPGTTSILGSNPSTPLPGEFNIGVTANWTPGSSGLASGGAESYTITVQYTYSFVPEPASMILIGSGLLGVGLFARRKRKS